MRLCDVAPDGTPLLVTRGLLNLTRRDGHDATAPLEPGARHAVHVRLDAIGQRVPTGHRLRVAISTAYWPWAWPSPQPVTLTVFAGPACHLELPLRAPRSADGALAPFGEPEWSEPLEQDVLRSDPTSRTLAPDLATGAHELASAGTSAGTAGSRTAAPSSTTRTSRPTASSTATRTRRACAAAAHPPSRAATGTRVSRPTAT